MHDLTPTERLALEIESLKAQLILADERLFFLVAELAKANARLGVTDYATQPLAK